MVQEVEKDPFELNPFELRMVAKPTREITFGLLATDKNQALTPRDIEEQFKNLERFVREGRWVLSQWDRKADPYHRILGRLDSLIREVNRRTKDIRTDAERAARDNRERKPIPMKFGIERNAG